MTENPLHDARVLVIGGAGFIGSHIVDQLLAEPVERVTVLDTFVRGTRANLGPASADPRVTVVEGSVLDLDLLRSLMGGHTHVFHLAALWLFECVHEPRLALEHNVVGTYNVVETAQQAGIRRVVYSSSASVYGNARETPMTEDHPFDNRTMYGATKIAGEQFFRAFNEQHGLDYVGLRYMNVYGPRMDDKGTYVSVVVKVLDKIDAGERPVVWGDGSQAYDFIHVGDIARCNILAMKATATDRFYNVGTGVRTTIRELVERLIAQTGSDVEPEYKADAQMFVTHRVGSTEAATTDLGFEATIGLDEGLRSIVEFRRAAAAAAPVR